MKKTDKWKKWKISASSAAAVMVLFTIVQNSDAFRQQVLASGASASSDTLSDLQQQNDRMQQWADSSTDNGQGYDWNERSGNGHGPGRSRGGRGMDSDWTGQSGGSSSGDSSSGDSSWSTREYSNGSGMQSRTGRS